MTTSLLDAFDLLAHSEQLQRRLEAAVSELTKVPGLAPEKVWLEVARQRVTAAREGIGDLVIRVLRLPELEPVKGDYTRLLQGAAVDALEKLYGGITLAGGPRSPLLEALYAKLKLPVMRRCSREEFERMCADFEKRLGSSYARRMLADETYTVVAPALENVHASFATWRGIFIEDPPSEEEASALRDELEATAHRLELPCRQGRLLAQAALVPLKELLDGSGLAQKPKRRGGRADGDEDTHTLLEEDPRDPSEPTPEELEEIRAVQASGEARTDSESEETKPARSRKGA